MEKCKKCASTGYITGTNKTEFVGFCDCTIGQELRRSIWEQKLIEVGILKEFWHLKFKDFCIQSTYPKHVQFMRDLETYLTNIRAKHDAGELWLIFGDLGVGKTLAASLILKEALKKDYTAKYISWTDLVDGSFNDEELMQKVRDVDFLVIDDLGKDKMNTNSSSKFAEDLLEKTIKYRFSSKLPTILVSARNLSELIMRFPILTAMIARRNISEVTGQNFRTNDNLKRS
jgi:DNA replication protein DnaC